MAISAGIDLSNKVVANIQAGFHSQVQGTFDVSPEDLVFLEFV